MGAIYRLEPTGDPKFDQLEACYGWIHLRAFTELLADEEDISLTSMLGYGGTTPWSASITTLRPLFDMDLFENGRLSSQECAKMRDRLHEVCELWSNGLFVGRASRQMKLDQASTMKKLVALVDACVETGRALVIS